LFKSGQQFAKEGAQLHPSERRSKAKVNTNSERKMVFCVLALDIEAKWLFKHFFIAIGGEI
jgi:hypothetical protein